MSRRVLRGFDAHMFATLRRERGFSVSDLARLSETSLSTIHHWESGRRTPQIDILAVVMAVLQAPIEAVVRIKEDERFPGDWRVMKGLTQPQLAAQAQLPTATVQRIERGEHPLSDANADTLSGLLGVSPQTYRDAYHRARHRPPGTSC
ncbi:helix-turn-helix transcriptional regulator [Mycolicibacterium neoaurum]|nr:helix-turn-helix transcriptional regulator [Mycolicibacterium neoaurum]